MVHPGSANRIGRSLAEATRKGGSFHLGPDSNDDRHALRETINRKAEKSYQSDGCHLGLLIYLDGVFHPTGMPQEWAERILGELGPPSRWDSIWLYDAATDRVIARWQR